MKQVGSESTKERILLAATAEFAARGLAGARIDRIAAAAEANKERIYAYFGNKERLFATVMREAAARSEDWLPASAENLPGKTGDLFDLAFRWPEVVRLLAWWHLEGDRVELTAADTDPYRAKAETIRSAQQAGAIDPYWDPSDLLAIVGALALAWVDAPEPLIAIAESDGKPVRDRRAAIEEAIRRIVRP